MAPPPIFTLLKYPKEEKKKLSGSTKLSQIIIHNAKGIIKRKNFIPKSRESCMKDGKERVSTAVAAAISFFPKKKVGGEKSEKGVWDEGRGWREA